MSADVWLTSDHHFGHQGIISIANRPFSSLNQMHEEMISAWNDRIKPDDLVFHLGDFAFTRKDARAVGERLNGRKYLILGNHDRPMKYRLHYIFQEIKLWKTFKERGLVCTHAPLTIDQFPQGAHLNVHGHTHKEGSPTPQHRSVCVEQTNYFPVNLEEFPLIASKPSR